MVPIVSIVGKSNIGKTTLLEKLIGELVRRGYRVAAVKHDVHGFDLDQPGKDSWRFAQAGSQAVVISSPQKMALLQQVQREMTLDEIAALLGPEVDIILTEGYKRGDKPKIEVSRQQVSQELLCQPQELIAIATDHPFSINVPQFGLEDVAGLADLLEDKYLRWRWPTDVSLLVDGKGLPLKGYVRQLLDRTVRALVSTLEGGEGAGDILLRLRAPRAHHDSVADPPSEG